MKVLITNYRLDGYSGTEVVVRDLSLALKRQGHEALVYSPRPGAVSQEIERHGIEVVTDLATLGASAGIDIIHGHHHGETLQAMHRFPDVPAIFVCHGGAGRIDEPFFLPRILRYAAVDNRCRARIASVPEIPKDRIQIMLNAVDLDRFCPRPPLPDKPQRALVFSNFANRYTHLPAIRQACKKMGLALDVLGAEAGTQVPDPHSVLPRYDLVFAKARCALEAMAVGCAVILCDFSGSGPLVTSENFDQLRPMNFGAGVMTDPLLPEPLVRQIDKYDAADASGVSRRVRQEAGLTQATGEWIALYRTVISEFRQASHDREAERPIIARHLQDWNEELKLQQNKDRLIRIVRRVPLLGDFIYYQGRKLKSRLE